MKREKGQALVLLLFFVIVAMIITTASVLIIIENSLSTSSLQSGQNAYDIAEAGVENALIRLLRDPGYEGEETMDLGEGSAEIRIEDGADKTITSIGTFGNFQRTIEVGASFVNNELNVTSWREIY